MNSFSRRKFLQTSMMGAAGLYLLPVMKGCGDAPSDQLRLGFIGLGQQSTSLLNGFYQNPGIKVVAGSDVYGVKRERFEMLVREHQQENDQNIEITTTENYQDLLAREDIDAVIIATPDHWHAIQTIDACRAGKHIYLEKPVTFTIQEGIDVTRAVRENNIILGVGSQQRSDPNFQHAVDLVREERLGELTKINAWVGPPPNPYDLEEKPLPDDLNWEKWLGPNPYVHYNPSLNPPISLDPVENETFWAEWRYFKETGGGSLCDWGAHNFDIVQWALNKDDSGPIEVMPAGHNGYEHISYYYENGLLMVNEPFTDDENFGVRFQSDDAWIEVHRGEFRASDNELMPPDDVDVDADEYEQATPHLTDFIQAVRNRSEPIAPIEAGHRTATIGILGNIATELDRPVRWNPEQQKFVDDSEADRYLHRDYRNGYML